MPIESFPLPTQPIRLAAVQEQSVPGDVPANAAAAAVRIREAADRGARVVVFPEKFLSGYEPDLIRADPQACAVREDDPRLAPIARACRATATTAVVGAAVGGALGDLTVSALVIGPDGEPVTRYDKQHLFKSERDLYHPGSIARTLDVDGWKLALGICYDSGFPEHARAAALSGAHAYLVGALFSVGQGHHESRVWFPARAYDNTLYALLANHVGRTGGWHTCGASAIWGPDGRLVAEGSPDRPEVVVADLDPEHLRAVRASKTMLEDLERHAAMSNDSGRR